MCVCVCVCHVCHLCDANRVVLYLMQCVYRSANWGLRISYCSVFNTKGDNVILPTIDFSTLCSVF